MTTPESRRRDARLHELLTGEKVYERYGSWHISGQESTGRTVPAYGDDGNAMLEVIERMRERGCSFAIRSAPFSDHVECEFWGPRYGIAESEQTAAAVRDAAIAALEAERGEGDDTE